MTPRPDRTFQRYAEAYRLAAGRLVVCAGASPGAGASLAPSLIRAWRHHLQLCLEHLLDGRGLDGGEASDGPAVCAWRAARRVLERDGAVDLAVVDAGQRALAAAEAGLAAGCCELPGGLAALHATLLPVSEALVAAARRLERRREHERQLLTWIA